MIDPTFKKANILIVDDQEANVEVLESLLTLQGYLNVKTTTDSREVVRLFAEFEPDLILLDLMMPYLNGFEVMDQLKNLISENTYLPILVLTADVTPEAKQRALSGGAHDFLIKPFDLVEVGLRIKNLLYTSYLQQQLLNQNIALEEKVKERTSELEQKNKELTIAKEKAVASDKLKTSFINSISHEIRTPLNGILGFGQILADPGLLPDDKELYLDMLNESSDRLINTVTNFLDVSLLASGNMEVFKKEFNLDPLVKNLVDRVSNKLASKNLTLTIEPDPNLKKCKIKTDSELLSKILFQLVDNAIKFTPNGGSVTLGYHIQNKGLSLYISDTGIGISKEYQNYIFDYFRQEEIELTRHYEGSGLGLAISKGMVGLLDGKISLKTEKGKGTTVDITLPDVVVYEADNITDRLTVKSLPNGKQTILVAEDNENNFTFMKIILKHKMIEVLHAQNGFEAVELFKSNNKINLVLMDLKMPGMDGFEATRIIKSINPAIPVFAVTAYVEHEDKMKTIEAGCNEFISKPIKKDLLYEKLAKYGIQGL